jgi:hypothetical protein
MSAAEATCETPKTIAAEASSPKVFFNMTRLLFPINLFVKGSTSETLQWNLLEIPKRPQVQESHR